MTNVTALRRMTVTQDHDAGGWRVKVWTKGGWKDAAISFDSERSANMFLSCNPHLEA
jgi:hypothetical protein